MIQIIARRLAVSIKRVVPDHRVSAEVMEFSLSALLNAFFIIVISLGVAIFTGRISEAATILVAFAVLRQVSGGKHLEDGVLCIVVSTAGVLVLSMADFSNTVVHALNVASLLLAIIFAPSRIEGQTRIPKRFYPLLKVIAILIIAANLFIGSSVLAATFFVQALTLIRGRR